MKFKKITDFIAITLILRRVIYFCKFSYTIIRIAIIWILFLKICLYVGIHLVKHNTAVSKACASPSAPQVIVYDLCEGSKGFLWEWRVSSVVDAGELDCVNQAIFALGGNRTHYLLIYK